MKKLHSSYINIVKLKVASVKNQVFHAPITRKNVNAYKTMIPFSQSEDSKIVAKKCYCICVV